MKKNNLQQSLTSTHPLRFLLPLAVVGGFFISLVDRVKRSLYKGSLLVRTFKFGGKNYGCTLDSSKTFSMIIQTAYALMVCGFLCVYTFADPPPPTPGDTTVQVFSPDELLLIDSYPDTQQTLVSFSIANAEPLPPLASPPEFPSGTVVVARNVYITNNIPPAPRKVFELIPSTSKDGTNFVHHPVNVFVDCKEDNEFYRLLIIDDVDFYLCIPQYRTNLTSDVWIDSDIRIAISGADSNTVYRLSSTIKGIKK